jgi:hypothetical protein
MKYILMMNMPHATGAYQNRDWAPGEFEAHMAYMQRLNLELAEAGELVAVEALASPGQARLVQAGAQGVPVVTDGPFPEAKEFLAGYWIVEVERPERAYVIAAQASAAPRPGGAPLNMPIEVREVMHVGGSEL